MVVAANRRLDARRPEDEGQEAAEDERLRRKPPKTTAWVVGR